MSAASPPPIDSRSSDELVEETRKAIAHYLGLADGSGVPGEGFVQIFARLAEVVVERLNRVPEKNLVAFLDLVGISLEPPQAARVPLTFSLAAGAPTFVRIPARTQVAAVAEAGETDPPVFETERELVATTATIVAACTRDPLSDTVSDITAVANGDRAGAVPVFAGAEPVAHDLYIGDSVFGLEAPKDITLELKPLDQDVAWPSAVEWTRWDGSSWKRVEATASAAGDMGEWRVTLAEVPPIPATTVAEHTSSWVRGRLKTPLPGTDGATDLVRQSAAPDHALTDGVPQATNGVAGRDPALPFALASARAFTKPGAEVTVEVELNPAAAVAPSSDLALAWEYWDGGSWQELGRSTPVGAAEPADVDRLQDGTRALTEDGKLAFRSPRDWAATGLGGTVGFWLRARVTAGRYVRPPAVRRCAVRYEWPLPKLDAVETSVHAARSRLSPDAAFANSTPIDLSKDFLPFGDRPSLSDTLYLASDEAFSLPGATVTLTVTPSHVDPPSVWRPTAKLAWEFWNGATGRWEDLSPTDATDSFASTKEATVTFPVPASSAPVEVNGQARRWIRARIVSGDYGSEAAYEPVDSNDLTKGYKLVQPTLHAPSLAAISVEYDYTVEHAATDETLVANEARFEEPKGDFAPYTPLEDTRPSLYLGLDGDLAGEPMTLYFSIAETPYRPGAEQAAALEPAAVVWEYWNGQAWAQLGTSDETRGFRQSGLVTFIGPPDLARSRDFGRVAFWLRARWERGAYPVAPRVQRILTNTTWASHVRTIENEVLGSGTGAQNLTLRPSAAPVLPGQKIEVREPDAPSARDQATIEAEEGLDAVTIVPADDGERGGAWVRWHEVVDFTGSGPRSRHYVIDRLTGEVRFGDGRRGMTPPEGQGNIRAAFYRTGGGARGNRPVETIAQLKSTVPYVDKVTNWQPAGGGADAETVAAATARGPRTLRHGDRAVAISDFEDLALEASTAVARVKGISAADAAGAGSVGLVVVPASADPQPVPSLELLAEVRRHIQARLSPTCDLWVGGPGWLLVTVTAQIVPLVLEEAIDVESVVRTRLATFLHPLSGGLDGSGWPFGRAPYRSDVLALLETVPGVDHVRSLSIAETLTEPGPAPEAVLVYSGEHRITMVGKPTGDDA